MFLSYGTGTYPLFLCIGTYLPTSTYLKIYRFIDYKERGWFLKAPDPTPNPFHLKNFDFQSSPLWFFAALKICWQIKDK